MTHLLFLFLGVFFGIALMTNSPVASLLFIMCFWLIFGFTAFSDGFEIRRVGMAKLFSILAVGAITSISSVGIYGRVLHEYGRNPSFHAKVNAYVFMGARYQAQLDPHWFEKKRTEISRHTQDVQRMRSVCGDPVAYREIVRSYNLAIDNYNKAILGSMVGLQYSEPVKQLLEPHFNGQFAPCGSVFRPI
jgi:hypothetical protein